MKCKILLGIIVILIIVILGMFYYNKCEAPTHVCIEKNKSTDYEHCIGNLSPTERTCYTKWDFQGRNFCETKWVSIDG